MHVTLTLQEAVTLKAIECNLLFNEYKLLAEWLEAYQYVLPNNRGLDVNFSAKMCKREYLSSCSGVYKFWMICNIVETSLLPIQQSRILTWMNQQILLKQWTQD